MKDGRNRPGQPDMKDGGKRPGCPGLRRPERFPGGMRPGIRIVERLPVI